MIFANLLEDSEVTPSAVSSAAYSMKVESIRTDSAKTTDTLSDSPPPLLEGSSQNGSNAETECQDNRNAKKEEIDEILRFHRWD